MVLHCEKELMEHMMQLPSVRQLEHGRQQLEQRGMQQQLVMVLLASWWLLLGIHELNQMYI